MSEDRLDEFLLPAALAPAVWAAFDAGWYARAYPQAGGGGYAALRAHYLTHGQGAGFSPGRYFDEGWYRAAYPDVAEAVAAGMWRSGFEHYCLEGHADRSGHMLFDDAGYAADHPELTDEALHEAGCFNRYDHYLKLGAAAGARGHRLFDALCHGVEAGEAFGHYLDAVRFGAAEPAPSALFDPVWYLAFHPVAAGGVAQRRFGGALHHYLSNATPTRFDPVPDFAEAFYLETHAEAVALVAAGVFRNGYDHFLAVGRALGLAPAPWVDLAFYGAQRAGGSEPFAHLLTEGRKARWRAAPAKDGGGGLPLLARGRLDFTLHSGAELTAVLVVSEDRAQALAALAMLATLAPGAVELVLLDCNGEAGGLAAMAPGAIVVPWAAGQLGEAWNAALRMSTGAAVLLLDGAAIPTAAGVRAGLKRLQADASVGAVGGPVVGEDGTLLQAGVIVFRDGRVCSYMHGAASQVSEAGFVRDADGFGGTQVLLRRAALEAIGGFAEAAGDGVVSLDACLLLWQAGYRVVYDPALAVALPGRRALRVSGIPAAPSAWMAARHEIYLAAPRRGSGEHGARSPGARQECILVTVARLPAAWDEAAVRVEALAEAGTAVTLYPMDGGPADPALLPSFLPETVEIICGPGEAGLRAFMDSRGDGFFARAEAV